MAMQISKPSNYGVNATYWRIEGGTIDYGSMVLRINVAGYLDAAARDAGKAPLAFESVAWSGVDFPDVAEPTRVALYTKLMAMPEWAGAVEV